jgi:hypothetical protein
MVPALDERLAHAAEVAARFALLKSYAGLTYGQIDYLAGFDTVGHARKLAEAAKVPGVPKARKFAALFGTSDAWLLCGAGAAPGKRRVLRAVAAARARREGGHAAKVTTSRTADKGRRSVSRSKIVGKSARP